MRKFFAARVTQLRDEGFTVSLHRTTVWSLAVWGRRPINPLIGEETELVQCSPLFSKLNDFQLFEHSY